MSEVRGKQKPRTWLVLLALVVVAGALTALNMWRTGQQVELATGPPTAEQERYYAEALDRPDLMSFFKSLSKAQKLAWCRNLAAHDDPKMIGLAMKFLEDFDEDVRAAATDSLMKLGAKLPEDLSRKLHPASSFQELAIVKALRSLGDAALPHVAARLRDADTRANAAGYLVQVGKPAPLLEALGDESADVRLAAAEALGKLRVVEAVLPLTALYQKAEGPEQLGYLSALAAIGSPRSEGVLGAALDDRSLLVPTRVDAALGLGRTGTAAAASKLWGYADHEDRDLARGALDALRLAGDAALTDGSRPLEQRLEVAAGVRSAKADTLIRQGLVSSDRSMRMKAASVAAERPSVVPAVLAALEAADGSNEGDLMDALVRTLMSTAEGRTAADKVAPDSIQGAFVKRARS